jgi:hypothetical protein
MVENVEIAKVADWAFIEGIWEQSPNSLTFAGLADSDESDRPLFPRGIAISAFKFANGRVRTTIKLPQSDRSCAGSILLGFSSQDSSYIAAGIGGLTKAYFVQEYANDTGWRELDTAGRVENLKRDHSYQVEVGVEGQRILLSVDGVKVLDHTLREPFNREQIGLYAHGKEPVEFGTVEILSRTSSAFVVMQFGPPYDELYNDVIKAVCSEFGLEAFRADDMNWPGVIIQDIVQGLTESHLVIADVTPANCNVFYELGYSHALNKQTILLADRKAETLPFDIRSYRVIFYDNTIGGKSAVETDLRRHLTSILGQ